MEGALVATIGTQPIGVKETVCELLAILYDHVANVAEWKSLQQQVEDENASAQASPQIREEYDVDDRETNDDATKQKLYENRSGYNWTQCVAVSKEGREEKMRKRKLRDTETYSIIKR